MKVGESNAAKPGPAKMSTASSQKLFSPIDSATAAAKSDSQKTDSTSVPTKTASVISVNLAQQVLKKAQALSKEPSRTSKAEKPVKKSGVAGSIARKIGATLRLSFLLDQLVSYDWNTASETRWLSAEKFSITQSEKAITAHIAMEHVDPLLSFRAHNLDLLKIGMPSLPTALRYKINPFVPFCPHSLDGVCNDTSCQLQHPRDVNLNEEELFLVCCGFVSWCIFT